MTSRLITITSAVLGDKIEVNPAHIVYLHVDRNYQADTLVQLTTRQIYVKETPAQIHELIQAGQ